MTDNYQKSIGISLRLLSGCSAVLEAELSVAVLVGVVEEISKLLSGSGVICLAKTTRRLRLVPGG